jgi:hypothetical protein
MKYKKTIISCACLCFLFTGCSNYVEKPSGTYQTEAVVLQGPSGNLSGNPVADDMVIVADSDESAVVDNTAEASIQLVNSVKAMSSAYIRMDVIKNDGTLTSYVLKYKDNYSYVAYGTKTIVSNTDASYLMYSNKKVAYKAAVGTFSFSTWDSVCTLLNFDIEDYKTSGKKVVNGVSVNYDTFGTESIYTKDGELYGVSYGDRDIVFNKITTCDSLDDFKIPSDYSIETYTK